VTQLEIMCKLEEILEEVKAGILVTIDANGRPHMRWMTPSCIKDRPNTIFTVTSPQFPKVEDLNIHPYGEWMIQTRSLNQIVNLRGKVNLLNQPSLKSELLENIGDRLTMFWKVNENKMDFLVLETVIEEGIYFEPMKGIKEKVFFA